MSVLLAIAVVLTLAVPAATAPVASTSTDSTRTWRVQTSEYLVTADSVTVPDFGVNDQPGAPALPVTHKLMELPQTGEWAVSYAGAARTLALPTGFVMVSVPVPAKDKSDYTEWTMAEADLSVPTINQPDSTIYGRNAFYPALPVVVGREVWQRGQRLLALTVFPFQYNPARGELRYTPDLTVTVTVTDIQPTEGTLRGSNSTIPQPSNIVARGQGIDGALRIYTSETGGMTRLTYSDLQSAGVPVGTVNPATFAMSYLGNPIRIQVTGEGDGSFDPGDIVIFYAEPYVGRYMTNNVYWLSYGGANGARMTVRTAPQNTGITPTTLYTETTRVEFDRLYISTIADGLNTDAFWDNALQPNNSAPPASASKSVVYTLPLDDPARVGSVYARANVHGVNNQSWNPDHAIRLKINTQDLGVFTWEGPTEYLATTTVAATALTTSTNQLTVTAALADIPGCPTDCPFAFVVYPNWVEMEYVARADAESDQILLDKVQTGAERVRVTGISLASGGNARAYDLRDPANPVILSTVNAVNAGGSYTVDFWDNPLPNPAYALSTDAGLLAPVSVRLDTPSNWGTSAHIAEYIAITHEYFYSPTPGYSGLDDLLAHRQAEGLTTAKIDVQDIYDEFSGGRVDPQAIRDFLTYAYFNWNAGSEPPEYVLLVGDGTYDFQNVADLPNLNFIPPYIMAVDPFIGEAPTDNRFVSVDGHDDDVPDMAIGRLPAQVKIDLAQQNPPVHFPAYVDLDSMVDKIIGYETTASTGAWQSRTAFAADNFADPAGNFHILSDQIINNWLPPAYTASKIYLASAEYPTGNDVRAGIKQALNNDVLMLQWFGHASHIRWGSQSTYNIFDSEGYGGYVPLNPNDEYALVISYACVSSYFISTITPIAPQIPIRQSLGESTMRATERAAIADIGPTGNHIGSAMLKINEGVVYSAFQEREERVGWILNDAKYYYLENATFFFDLLDTTVLLGDPATRLKLPPIAHAASTFSVNDSTPAPGQGIQFSLTVANTDTVTLTDTVLTVDYDQTLLTITDATGWENNGDILTQEVATVPPGGITVHFSAQVNVGAINGTLIDTEAKVSVARENVTLNKVMTVTELPTATPTITPTNSPGPSPTATQTATPGASPTATATNTPGPSPTTTATNTPGPSPTATATNTPGPSPTATLTPTTLPTASATATLPPQEGNRVYLPLIRR